MLHVTVEWHKGGVTKELKFCSTFPTGNCHILYAKRCRSLLACCPSRPTSSVLSDRWTAQEMAVEVHLCNRARSVQRSPELWPGQR